LGARKGGGSYFARVAVLRMERQEWIVAREGGQSHVRVKPRERMVLPTTFFLLLILFRSRDMIPKIHVA
jgi:hypothetical protein